MRHAVRARFALPVLVLLSAAPVARAIAQETPPPGGAVEGEVRFGLQYYLSQQQPNSAKFEEYRDVPNGFVAERLLFSWTPDQRFHLDVDALDVTQRDQRIVVDFGKTDLWRGTIHWTENRRLWTDDASTLFARHDNAVFTLEDSFQSAVQAAVVANVDSDGDNVWDPGTKGRVVQLAVQSGAQDVFVGHQRRTGGIAFEITPSRRWTFSLAADRDRRDGTTPQTLGMYFALSPAEVAAPYDLRTDWLKGSAEFSSPRANVGLQVSTSVFETGFNSLTWDNQLFLTDTATANPLVANPGRGRMSLWTDSNWTRLGVFAGFNLPARTRIDASFSRIETMQEEDSLLPMTINSLLAPSPLPASRFDGEHVTTYGQVRITSHPFKQLRWGAWARLFELSNHSPKLTFDDYVQTDYQIPVCGNVNVCDANGNANPADDRIARRNLPYGFERINAGAMVGWSPVSWFDGAVSFERENMQRDFSAVEDSDEDTVKLTLDFDPGERWGLRATLKRQERRADEYDVHYQEESFPIGEPAEAGFNEGSRRFYWTDRDRDAATLLADWSPTERWSLYAEGTYQNDAYMDPETGRKLGDSFTVHEDRNFDTVLETYDILLAGRTDDRMTSWTVGAAFTPSPRIGLNADYTFERWKYGLESRYRNVVAGVGTDDPLDNWGSDVTDDYKTANFGLEMGLTRDSKWHLSIDSACSKGTGDIRTHFVPGGAASGDTSLTRFPELKTTLIRATAELRHTLRANLDYAVRYWFESWNEDNFSADFNRPYMGAPRQDPSMAQALYLGLDFKDYTNHIISVMMRYRY